MDTSICWLNDFQDFTPKDLKVFAMCDLAFWCNPAWLEDTPCLLSKTAATQWVLYHRISMNMNKISVAQLIGSVKGVIPNSKLAKYGDYSYNSYCEDMYLTTENMTFKHDKNDESNDSRHHFSSSFSNQDHSSISREGKDVELKRIRRWLMKMKNVLDGVKCIVNENQLLDFKSLELLKLCSRFIEVTNINESLIDTLKSEIAFTTDYEQLQNIPVSGAELQSIPQPQNETDSSSNYDDMWLRLSLEEVRKWWNDDAKSPFSSANIFSNPLAHLMKINFLRRQKNQKKFGTETIDIPKESQRKLLGSLLDDIEETPLLPTKAHGEWTKRLFPCRTELNSCLLGKTATDIIDSGVKARRCDSTTIAVEEPENLVMPVPFYKSVLPSNLTPVTIHKGRPPSHDMHCLPRKSLMQLQPSYVATIHPPTPQVRFIIPSVPTVYVPQPVSSPNWINPYHQRMNASLKMITNGKYSRMSAPTLNQFHIKKEITEIQKYLPRSFETNFNSGKNLRVIEMPRKDKYTLVNVENELPSINFCLKNKPLVQTSSYESIKILQNSENIFSNSNNTFQPILCDKYVQPIASNIYNMKTNSHLQVLEPVTPININHSLMDNRSSSQLIQHAFPLGNQKMAQFELQPMFWGTKTNNTIKQRGKIMYEKYKTNEMYKMFHQGTQKVLPSENLPLHINMNYEDKVENWLQTVNKYIKSNSFANFEELSEACQFDTSNSGDKWKVETNKIARKCHNKLFTRTLQTECINIGTEVPHKLYNLKGFPAHNLNLKKEGARQLLLKHLQLFRRFNMKLKKCRNLESKIKCLKKYFAEVNLKNSNEMHLRNKARDLKLITRMPKNKYCDALKNPTKLGTKQKTGHKLKTHIENRNTHSSDDYFDEFREFFFPNDVYDYKVLIYENPGYNSFPSKRTKVKNSLLSFVENGSRPQDELTKRVVSLKYFEKVIDELFFCPAKSENINEDLKDKFDLEVINGWTHFKFTVKYVLKNITSFFEEQISQAGKTLRKNQ